MPNENKDVKSGTESSTVATGVKNETFESVAGALVDGILKDSPPDAEKESVSKLDNDKEKEPESKVEDTKDETAEKNDSPEKSPTEEQTEDNDETKPDETESEEDKAKESETSKTEESIPYARFKEVNEKAQSYEGSAKAYQTIVDYNQQNKISPEQFREGLQTLAMINNDPEKALPMLENMVSTLKVRLGKGLPPDLQKEVDEGILPEVRAKELAQLRLKGNDSESQTRLMEQRYQEQQRNDLTSGLSAWSANQKRLNPAFTPSTDPVNKPGIFEDFIVQNNHNWTVTPPRNSAEAIALADKSLKEVMDRMKRYAPKPSIKKAPPSSGRSRSLTKGEPKSVEDIIDLVGSKHGY